MAIMSAVMIRSVSSSQPVKRTQLERSRPATGHHAPALKEIPPFRPDLVNECVWRSGVGGKNERILMKPKPFPILRRLVGHAGGLVTQDELVDAVWPDAYVQPEVLKRHIFDVRIVLRGGPGQERLMGWHCAIGEVRKYFQRALGGQRQIVFIRQCVESHEGTGRYYSCLKLWKSCAASPEASR